MKKLLLALALCLAPSLAWAQSPQCPTRPSADATNACASTAFVHNVAGSGSLTIPATVVGTVTSGGIPYFNSTVQMSSSGLLATNQIVLGGGAGGAPTTLGSLGSATTVLHGGAGAPTFGAVVLTTDVSGILPVPNGGSGAATFTAHGVLLGEGTAAFTPTAAMTNGQLLVGQTGADPLPKTVSGDVTIVASGATAIGANKITNAMLATATSSTLKGNPTSGTTNETDFTIQGLTHQTAPNAATDAFIIHRNATDTFQYTLLNDIAASLPVVTSLNALTGNLNIVAGSGISVAASGGAITITNTGGGGGSNCTTTANSIFCGGGGGSITTGVNNATVGINTGGTITSGSEDTLLGYAAGQNITTAGGNTLLGYAAGFTITTSGGTVPGNNNTYVGFQSGYGNTTGGYNVAVGLFASQWMTTGTENTSLGATALLSNTTGIHNVAIGANALGGDYDPVGHTGTAITGSENVAVGYNTLLGATSGSNNTCVGAQSCYATTPSAFSGSNNTALGWSTLTATTGGSNTVAGVFAGRNITSGTANVTLGQSSGASITTGSNNVVLGHNINTSTGIVNASGAVVIGNDCAEGNGTGVIVICNGLGTPRAQISNAGVWTLSNYTAGLLLSSSAGVISTTSASGLAKAWGYCTNAAGTYTLQTSFNISGATCGKTGTGAFTITFSTAFANASFPCIGSAEAGNGLFTINPASTTTASAQIRTSTTGANVDAGFNFVCFGS